jgi:SAM-dependent methyltransferase
VSAAFDGYAEDYDAALARGVSVSGEDKDFFARGRIAWLANRLREIDERPTTLLDFGCGTGSAAPLFVEQLGVDRVLGVDESTKALDLARSAYGSDRVRFMNVIDYHPSGDVDIAFCNGVFHHIPPGSRPAALAVVRTALRPRGLFAFCENNPWNPGTRYVMSRIPFDRDAVTLSVIEARRLLRANGFHILQTDFLFIFPSLLRACRPIERYLSRAPFGAQYSILCRRM